MDIDWGKFHEFTKKYDPAAHYAVDHAWKSSTRTVNKTAKAIGWDWLEGQSAKDEKSIDRWWENSLAGVAAVFGGMYGAGALGGGEAAAGGAAGGAGVGAAEGGAAAGGAAGAAEGGAAAGASEGAAGGSSAGGASSWSKWIKPMASGMNGAGDSYNSSAAQQQRLADALLSASWRRQQDPQQTAGWFNPNKPKKSEE